MLFDLRSRGRRRTVQVVYVGLAVLIAVGLIGFGVGTGSGGGGLFGGLSGNGSKNAQSSQATAQTKAAVKGTQAHPSSASAWAALVAARFSAANSVGFDSTTSTYTATGKQQLSALTTAYERYSKLTSRINPNTATYAARAYGQLGQYASAASAWQAVVAGSGTNLKGLECVALNSYAAKNTRVGQLAETQVLAKVPKTERASVKTQIESAKTQPTVVSQAC